MLDFLVSSLHHLVDLHNEKAAQDAGQAIGNAAGQAVGGSIADGGDTSDKDKKTKNPKPNPPGMPDWKLTAAIALLSGLSNNQFRPDDNPLQTFLDAHHQAAQERYQSALDKWYEDNPDQDPKNQPKEKKPGGVQPPASTSSTTAPNGLPPTMPITGSNPPAGQTDPTEATKAVLKSMAQMTPDQALAALLHHHQQEFPNYGTSPIGGTYGSPYDLSRQAL